MSVRGKGSRKGVRGYSGICKCKGDKTSGICCGGGEGVSLVDWSGFSNYIGHGGTERSIVCDYIGSSLSCHENIG